MKSHRWKKLDELQSDECRSHSDMINQRTMELAAASSSDATITNATDSYNESVAADSSVVEDVSCCSDDDGDNDAAVVVATSKIVPTTDDVHGSDSNGCIECNTPSNHSCQKCKNVHVHCAALRKGSSKMLGGATCVLKHKVSRTNS
jgi:hypothetical protein